MAKSSALYVQSFHAKSTSYFSDNYRLTLFLSPLSSLSTKQFEQFQLTNWCSLILLPQNKICNYFKAKMKFRLRLVHMFWYGHFKMIIWYLNDYFKITLFEWISLEWKFFNFYLTNDQIEENEIAQKWHKTGESNILQTNSITCIPHGVSSSQNKIE